MSDKLVPSDPEKVMVFRDLTPNITTLSVPFLRAGLIKFGGRATIVRLTSGQLAVFSPVALTPSVSTKLQALGNQVAYVAAPDLEHHIFLSEWHKAYPNAHFIAPEGLAEKRAEQSKDDKNVTNIHFQTIFTKKNKAELKVSEEFDNDFEYEFVDAHPNKEIVFYYKPDRTLIQADLLFNMPATEQYSKTGEDATSGWASKLFAGIENTNGAATWQKRMLWYVFSKRDRAGFSQSMKKINTWSFENIVPCHGDTIVGNGKGIFEKVMEWHLQGKK
ncbi:hypothetical protein DID88_007316 [Monilinia fructigena]|uniref:Nuclear protein Qri2/Nse4 n=1 Tax=Monilinia fructigena TaxID=38457 RepID=A0A395J8Y7_9HELO|nr:hypothetical protein DID88_007316 [Monilinia fructigena]